ncbi:MAG: hypothetical protein WD534_00665, partial [Phycisphaeraceae bacterium]
SPPNKRHAHVSTGPPNAYRQAVQHRLVFTHPALATNPATSRTDVAASGALEQALIACRAVGDTPFEAWVASPFFDPCEDDAVEDAAARALVDSLGDASEREVWLMVPGSGTEAENEASPRLAAPRSLLRAVVSRVATLGVELLPTSDDDGNPRSWHAKMLRFGSHRYTAAMIGSSNFTRAGMGVTGRYNLEANLLLIAAYGRGARDPRRLDELWPVGQPVEQPADAEWIGPDPKLVEEEQKAEQRAALPAGFILALFRGGPDCSLCLAFEPDALPETWSLHAIVETRSEPLYDDKQHREQGHPKTIDLPWPKQHPPSRLLVRWGEHEVGWPMNVEEATHLPPPPALEKMSADEMLRILAATDPAAAFRAWARRQQREREAFDDDLDAANAPDLDPLRRYDLRKTFLSRIRERARVLARVRQQLQRPAINERELHWRLEGIIGARAVVERLWREFTQANGQADEALLSLADLLISLGELEYESGEGGVEREVFERAYGSFLDRLTQELRQRVAPHRDSLSPDVLIFWESVLDQCRQRIQKT